MGVHIHAYKQICAFIHIYAHAYAHACAQMLFCVYHHVCVCVRDCDVATVRAEVSGHVCVCMHACMQVCTLVNVVAKALHP